MRIARVTGTVTATVKEPRLAALKLIVVDIEDGRGKVLTSAVVAVDSLGAGVGDQVLIVTGSAARVPPALTGVAVDAATVAIIDDIALGD